MCNSLTDVQGQPVPPKLQACKGALPLPPPLSQHSRTHTHTCVHTHPTLYRVRSSIKLLMSTSLKVDNMAYVFCAPLSRSATRCLRRVIFTRLHTPGGSSTPLYHHQKWMMLMVVFMITNHARTHIPTKLTCRPSARTNDHKPFMTLGQWCILTLLTGQPVLGLRGGHKNHLQTRCSHKVHLGGGLTALVWGPAGRQQQAQQPQQVGVEEEQWLAWRHVVAQRQRPGQRRAEAVVRGVASGSAWPRQQREQPQRRPPPP